MYEIGKELFYEQKNLILSDQKKSDVIFDFFSDIILFTKQESPLIELESLFDFMAERKRENRHHIEELYDRYVRLRFFKKAKAFSVKYKAKAIFEYLPPEITEPQTEDRNPKYYMVKDDGEKLELITADLNREKLIIGVVSTTCGASHRVSVINNGNNPEIVKAFQEYGILLLPQKSMVIKEILEWNGKHPDLPTHIVYKEEDSWPDGIRWDVTPNFFFFKNGKLVYTTFMDPYIALIQKNNRQMTCEEAFVQKMRKGLDMLEM